MRPPPLLRLLESRGIESFTTVEAEGWFEAHGRARVGAELRRLKAQGLLATPVRGFHVMSHGHRVRVLRVLDAMLAHLGLRYSVGGRTAARLHGVAVEEDGVVRVRLEEARRSIDLGDERVEFFQLGALREEDRERRDGRWVSSPHAVLWELVVQGSLRGGLELVVPLIRELAPRADVMELTLSAAAVPLTCVARLGFILERLGYRSEGAMLRPLVKEFFNTRVPLDPHRDVQGARVDDRWRLMVNLDW
jgi:hypothetical protein